MSDFIANPSAGFFRRIAVIVYDFLVAVAVYMLVGTLTTVVVFALVHFGVISAGNQTHFVDVIKVAHPWLSTLMLCINLLITAQVFVWFWSHGGQTLGMRAWRLKLITRDGEDLSIKQAWMRLILACAGLGNLWVLFDKHSDALHDKLSSSRMVVLSKEENLMRNWTRS